MVYHNFHRRKILVGSVYTAFTSQETFSKLWIIWGISTVKVFFLEMVFEEGIYNMSKGDVFVVSFNVRCQDVTKHVLNVAEFTLKWFVGHNCFNPLSLFELCFPIDWRLLVDWHISNIG